MKKYWFTAKRYGWGWKPASWQGWVILALAVLAMTVSFFDVERHSQSVSQTLIGIIPPYALVSAWLITICFLTGEKPKWRWGKH